MNDLSPEELAKEMAMVRHYIDRITEHQATCHDPACKAEGDQLLAEGKELLAKYGTETVPDE